MKRILALFCVLFLTFSLLAMPASAETAGTAQSETIPEIESAAAIVLDAQTGAILYRKNDAVPMPPADSAQILTVLLALESGKADQTVTVTKEIAATFDADKANIPLKEGEEVKIRDLLYAIMLQSYSDACKTVAVAVSGSEAAFSEAMTARMTKITGAKSSNFANADGEPHEGNKATANDLALLTKEAMKNEEFREIFGKVAYTMSATNTNSSTRDLKAICKLFKDPEYGYESTVGAKSGYNTDALYTLVSAAEKDGRTLICVLLGAEGSNQRYKETIALLNYGFTAFRNVTVPTDLIEPTEIPVMNKDGNYTRKITVSIPEGTLLTTNLQFKEGTMSVPNLPLYVQEGDTNISLTVSAKDENNVTIVLGTVNLNIETKEVESGSPAGGNKSKPMTVGQKIWNVIKTILLVILVIILGIILIIVVLFMMSYLQRRKRLANRRRRQEERMKEAAEAEAEKTPVYTGRRHRRSDENE